MQCNAYIRLRDGLLAACFQVLDRLGGITQINLCSDQDDGCLGVEVRDLRMPLQTCKYARGRANE